MKIELSKKDYEDLEELKSRPGYKVLRRIQAEKENNLLIKSFSIKSRTIHDKNVDYHETADEQHQRLNGIAEGMSFILNPVETAYDMRKKKYKEKE